MKFFLNFLRIFDKILLTFSTKFSLCFPSFQQHSFVMRSEKPYTKSENVIRRFSWHRIGERTRGILKQKNCLKSSKFREWNGVRALSVLTGPRAE